MCYFYDLIQGQPQKFQTEMEESVDTDIIYFSSGVHFNLVTGPECPSPLATNCT